MAVDLFLVQNEDGDVIQYGDLDPRGPRRTIEAVDGSKVTLSCGHVREWNQTFTYHVGETGRCYECRMSKQLKGERPC